MKRKSVLLVAAVTAAVSSLISPVAADAVPVPCEPNTWQVSWDFYGKPTTMKNDFYTEVVTNHTSEPLPFTITETKTKNFGSVVSNQVQFGVSSTLSASGDAIVAQAAIDHTLELSTALGLQLSYTAEGSWNSSFGPINVPVGETYIFRRGIGVQTILRTSTYYSSTCQKTSTNTFLNLGAKITYVAKAGGGDILDPDAVRAGIGLLGLLSEVMVLGGDGPDHYCCVPDSNIISSAPPQPTSNVVYEAASTNGWQEMAMLGASGYVRGSAVAALEAGSAKLVYTVVDGKVYEANSAASWLNMNSGIAGVSNYALAVISANGTKYIYTIKNGVVHEASSANGWQNLSTVSISGVSTALAAINVSGTKLIYTIKNGVVHEASSANGWQNLSTVSISGVSNSALAAMNVNGTKYIYTIKNGTVHEASSANGWQNLNSGAGATKVAAIKFGTSKIFYTL